MRLAGSEVSPLTVGLLANDALSRSLGRSTIDGISVRTPPESTGSNNMARLKRRHQRYTYANMMLRGVLLVLCTAVIAIAVYMSFRGNFSGRQVY